MSNHPKRRRIITAADKPTTHVHDFGEWGRIFPIVDDALFSAIPSECRSCAPCGLVEIRVLDGEPPEPGCQWPHGYLDPRLGECPNCDFILLDPVSEPAQPSLTREFLDAIITGKIGEIHYEKFYDYSAQRKGMEALRDAILAQSDAQTEEPCPTNHRNHTKSVEGREYRLMGYNFCPDCGIPVAQTEEGGV